MKKPVVEVKWHDACTVDQWSNIHTSKYKLAVNYTYGVLIKKNKRKISICPTINYNKADQEYSASGVTTIPRHAVISIKRLKTIKL